MQIKNSMLLLSAMTAGSAVARSHGHERRHAHHERGLGDIVKVNMGGKIVSWANDWAGGAAATTSASEATATQAAVADSPSQVLTVAVASATASASSSSTPVVSSGGSCSEWSATLDDDSKYTREGFGESTANNGMDYIDYVGNVGKPWGSNIIEVSASNACNYRHVIEVHGSETDPWTIVFWNKIGPDGKLTGWYNDNSALTLTLDPGETKYVAFDNDSQGSWGAAKGTKLPKDVNGGYACTWGEFDFGNESNNGWSGWDVSAIQVQNAKLEVQGMKICDILGSKCSSITNLAKQVSNAYTAAEEGVDGIGGEWRKGALRLHVHVDYNGDSS